MRVWVVYRWTGPSLAWVEMVGVYRARTDADLAAAGDARCRVVESTLHL